MSDNEHERQWKECTLGGIAAILSLIAVVADIFIGSSTGATCPNSRNGGGAFRSISTKRLARLIQP